MIRSARLRAPGRQVRLVDSDGPLPEPRLEEQLATAMADRLPGPLVTVLGVRGLLAASRALAWPLRAFSRMTGHGGGGVRA